MLCLYIQRQTLRSSDAADCYQVYRSDLPINQIVGVAAENWDLEYNGEESQFS